jgi:hypothetical protein
MHLERLMKKKLQSSPFIFINENWEEVCNQGNVNSKFHIRLFSY